MNLGQNPKMFIEMYHQALSFMGTVGKIVSWIYDKNI